MVMLINPYLLSYSIALCFTGAIYALLMSLFILISLLKQVRFKLASMQIGNFDNVIEL